jgi:hypothetical protein
MRQSFDGEAKGSAPVPLVTTPESALLGVPAIVQHKVLNTRRNILTKDAAGTVATWDLTGAVSEVRTGWHLEPVAGHRMMVLLR